MTEAQAAALLVEHGLRLPDAELAAYTLLVSDMEQAAAIARRPLSYELEPAPTFKLSKAVT